MTVPRLTYADGYQTAMHELTAILTQDGIDAMLVYLANNTVDGGIMDEWIDDIGYGDPNRFICTDPACHGDCGADNHVGRVD